MSKRKFTKRTATTSALDPATLAEHRLLQRLRTQATRTLLKRRRQKSGQ